MVRLSNPYCSFDLLIYSFWESSSLIIVECLWLVLGGLNQCQYPPLDILMSYRATVWYHVASLCNFVKSHISFYSHTMTSQGQMNTGAPFQYKGHLFRHRDFYYKDEIRQRDFHYEYKMVLIFAMWIPILARQHLYNEMVPMIIVPEIAAP